MNNYSDFLKSKLSSLNPTYLEIINESHLHANHNEQAKNGKTHFKIIINSNEFLNLTRVKIHQLIYKILEDEMKNTIHALSIIITSKQ